MRESDRSGNAESAGDRQALVVRLERSQPFRELIRKKRAFNVPASIAVLVFFLLLPILASFTTALNGSVGTVFNWAYVYAFAQFIVALAVSHLYVRRAAHLDDLAELVGQDAQQSPLRDSSGRTRSE